MYGDHDSFFSGSGFTTPYSTNVPPSLSSDANQRHQFQSLTQSSPGIATPTTSYSDAGSYVRYEPAEYQFPEQYQQTYPIPGYVYPRDPSAVDQETTSQPPETVPLVALNDVPVPYDNYTNYGTYDGSGSDDRFLRPPAGLNDESLNEAGLVDMDQINLNYLHDPAANHSQNSIHESNTFSEPWSPVNLRADSPTQPNGRNTLPRGQRLGEDLASTADGSEFGSSYQLDLLRRPLTSAEIKEGFVSGRCLLQGCKSRNIFVNYREYIAHIKRVHVRGFYCTFEGCTLGRAFAKKGDLNRHIAAKHNIFKNHICSRSTCTQKIKAWSRKDKLREHDKKHHWNYKCPHCLPERWFDTRQEVDEHIGRRHDFA
ncbi:hypothetical protein PVAG01_06589 [Phlyctema vagabunda]|uniref:C2H2-type domain-containing protein n=1 Tax=Phlyctema vagabunda TaxID=108571 RepID=A0ABR4PGI9_9HELO